MAKRNQKKSHIGRHIALFILLVAFACAAGYYAYEYQQWVGRFLPNTTVNGIDYSGMTAEEAKARFRETYAGRVLEIHELDGNTEEISYDDIDYHYTTGSTFEQLIESQDLWKWPLAYMQPTHMTTEEGFAFNEDLLAQKVASLNAITSPDIVDPSDAHIEKHDTGYVLIDAVDGNRLKEDRVLEEARKAVNEGASSIDLSELGCYKKASIYADNEELLSQFAVVDKYQNEEITLSMEGDTYVKLDKSVFLPWMTFQNKTVTFDSDAIINYTKALAEKYNTRGKKRNFRTTEGDVVEVGGTNYDNYGYEMNVEESADLIASALASGISQMIALAWDHYALARDEGGSDFGSTYIEVSLDEQHMWYYKDGNLVLDTNIVSGTATPKRATPTMVVQVLDKKTDHTMKGSYGESHADYALVIQESGILIHDSSWRDEYGDDIWLYDGSHGCINTPHRAMEELYDTAEISTPVIIYDRENRVTSFENEEYKGNSDDDDEDDEDDDDDDYDYDEYDYDEENWNDNEEDYYAYTDSDEEFLNDYDS